MQIILDLLAQYLSDSKIIIIKQNIKIIIIKIIKI